MSVKGVIMSEIIVGVSTAEQAGLHAVRWAARRASTRRARLHIVHVIDAAVEAKRDAQLMAAAKAEAQGVIDAAVAAAKEIDPTLEVVTTFEHGPATEVFDESVAQRRAARRRQRLARRSTTQPPRGAQPAHRRRKPSVPVAVIPDIDVARATRGRRRGRRVRVVRRNARVRGSPRPNGSASRSSPCTRGTSA